MTRFSLKFKEAFGVTVLIFLIVAITTVIHLSKLTHVFLKETDRQIALIEKQIFAQVRQSLSVKAEESKGQAIKPNPDLRSLVDASVGYSPHLLYAMLVDPQNMIILHTQEDQEGRVAANKPRFENLLSLNFFSQIRALYQGGAVYEKVFPLDLDGKPFGSIRLGIHTSLLKEELTNSLVHSLTFAGITLPIAWLVTLGLAALVLKPIHRIARQAERLRQYGEFDFEPDLNRNDEFRELASQLQLLGQQLKSDRLKMLGEKSHFQQVVDHLEDGIIFLNQDQRIVFCNKATDVIVGSSLEQARGARLDEVLESGHPLQVSVDQAFGQQTGFRNACLSFPHDGTSVQTLVSIFFIKEGLNALGAVVFLKDMESVKTIQSLISYSAKLTALYRLKSGVAHEIKNPLNAIAIHLELLKGQLEAAPMQARKSATVIEDQVRKLDRVVQGFLKFIRPQELNLTRFSLNKILEKEIECLETEWAQQGIHFFRSFDSTMEADNLQADEELLRQAFFNVLLNACQAMPRGGSIHVHTQKERNAIVRVTISDEGGGIPAEDLDNIFKLYFTTRPEGSGIGLSLTYRIIQLHDGSIEVESEIGKGTAFIIRLPQG